jgi:hypothetical protein
MTADPLRIPHSAFRIAVLLSATLAAACGYRLAGTTVRPPSGIRSLSVGAFENRSREFGLDKTLAFAFEREFLRRGLLRVEEKPDAGEAVLTGTIRTFTARPVAFDEEDEALQYEAELVVDLVLRRQSDQAVLWQASGLTEIEAYDVAARIVVPSTAAFQRGTTDVEDLRRLTDIQLAEVEKRHAIERLVAAIVHDAHDRIVEDF